MPFHDLNEPWPGYGLLPPAPLVGQSQDTSPPDNPTGPAGWHRRPPVMHLRRVVGGGMVKTYVDSFERVVGSAATELRGDLRCASTTTTTPKPRREQASFPPRTWPS
jgi:hypothetical protein